MTLFIGPLRCMGHIVNLAQQAFICALVGSKDWLEEPIGDTDELDLSGLEESPIQGPLIGPLLSCMQALVVQVSLILLRLSYYMTVRECPSSAFIPTNPDHARHVLPRSRHKTLDSTPKTVGTAVPKHHGKLYQLWETVTVLMILFRLHHLLFTI